MIAMLSPITTADRTHATIIIESAVIFISTFFCFRGLLLSLLGNGPLGLAGLRFPQPAEKKSKEREQKSKEEKERESKQSGAEPRLKR